MEQYAVVTGASQGLGKSFAKELAGRGIHLILVSLPSQNLSQFSDELQKDFKINVHYFEVDFSITANVISLSKKISQKYNVFLLINNAGIGGTSRFTDVDVSYIKKIIDVNVTATSILTHQLLPNLLKQPKGYILNVSSMAAFSPIGYKTVYPASKAFIHSFSRGLSEELIDTNVSVSVVSPGAMATNEEVTARIKKQGFIGRLTLLDPDKVAKKCIRKIFKKKALVKVNYLILPIIQLLPIWFISAQGTKTIKREVNQ